MPALNLTNVELASLANRSPHAYNQLSPEAKRVVTHLTAAPDADHWFRVQDKIVRDKIVRETEALVSRYRLPNLGD